MEWFNAVDATYRADLRELNELNFQRFDAKLEQRMAALETKMERRLAELEKTMIRWMFAFWAPTALAVITLLITLLLKS